MPAKPTRRAVRAELARILSNDSFDTSVRSRGFLRFVVERTLTGQSESISQKAIATEVFGRDEGFDPSIDPIVRIQAGRLRRSLERYYLKDGSGDPVTIEIPKGSYVPEFRERGEKISERPSPGWPIVMVAPLQDLTGRDDQQYLAHGMTSELATELSRYHDIRVVPVTHESAEVAGARFRITGDLCRDDAAVTVTVALTDLSTGAMIWGERFSGNPEERGLSGFRHQIAEVIAARIADEQGFIHLTLSAASHCRPPAVSGVYDALLRCYYLENVYTAESVREAQLALEHAVSLDPNCGLAHAMLARIYGILFGLGFPKEGCSLAETIELAHSLAARALKLEPANQRVRCIQGFLHLLSDDVTAAHRDAEVAFSLNPNSLCMLDAIGYILTLSGDWQRGPELVRRAICLNPCHRQAVHYALWIDAMHREDYQQAYDEALQCRLHGDFWAHLSVATSLVMLDRIPEAESEVAKLLAMHPDFSTRGRWLISRYVKFEQLVDLLIRSLHRAGLSCD